MGMTTLAFAAGNMLMQGLSNREEDKQIGRQIAAQNAQKQQLVREHNYTVQSLSQEQQDQFEQAVQQLQNNSINSIRNNGMLRAALGETGLEGRSMDSVMREVTGQDARVADSIRGTFKKSYAGIQQKKEVSALQTQSSLDGMPQIKGPSTLSRVIGMGTAAASGAQAGLKTDSFLKSSSGKEMVGTVTNLFKR